MKLNVLDKVINLLAVVGIFILIGAVGTCDYMVEIGEYYPLIETVKLIGLSFLFEILFIVS